MFDKIVSKIYSISFYMDENYGGVSAIPIIKS